MKIIQLKNIEILSANFRITYNKTTDGGSFNWCKSEIIIGIKSIKTDPLYTYNVISHEIMEIILEGMGARYYNGRINENYLFNFDHQTFENAIQLHAQIMVKFLKLQ